MIDRHAVILCSPGNWAYVFYFLLDPFNIMLYDPCAFCFSFHLNWHSFSHSHQNDYITKVPFSLIFGPLHQHISCTYLYIATYVSNFPV